MARKPRIHYPGASYHVILRGNGGQDIFSIDDDRIRFLLLLQEGVERYKHRIHGFCLMSNHVHLVIQVGKVSLSKIMQNVSFRYTRYYNAQQKRMGHLFQGRYKALLIDSDSYLTELVRYIHCNPIRSGIVNNPQKYAWSSHRAYLGEIVIPWLTKELLLSQFAKSKSKAIKLFDDFIHEGIEENHRREFHNGISEGRILGDKNFIEKVLSVTKERGIRKVTIAQIIEAVCEGCQIGKDVLVEPGKNRVYAEARAIAAYCVQQEQHLSLTALSRQLNRDLSALSRAAGNIRKQLGLKPKLSERVTSLQKRLH